MAVEERPSQERSSEQRASQAASQEIGRRLDSWKAIAEYLGRDVRSVQRWERGLGLPVHRVSGEKGGVVFAFTGELERWLQDRPGNCSSSSDLTSPALGSALAEEQADAPTTRPREPGGALTGSRPAPPWMKYAAAITAVVLLAACAMYVVSRARLRRASQRPQPPQSSRIMLAVLPFVNYSGASAQDYFADGLTEEMITDLGCLNPQALGVIARTSAMKYKNTNKDIAQIGRELGVSYILEGSVRREGNQARISAQLIRVSDQTHVWAQNYESQAKDILSVQRDVAATIADKIKINLEGGERRQLAQAQLTNPESYDDYLHGRYLLSQRTPASFRAAVKFFDQAIAKEPSFALAYAGLADSDVLLSFAAGDPSARAKAAALKALALDDNLAEAHTSLAAVDILDWDWSAAEKEFQRALALNPNYALAHHWYGDLYLSPMRRNSEAIAELKQAQELDPLSLIVNTDLGYAYYYAGDYDAAFSQYQKVLAVDPTFTSAHWELAQYYQQKKMYDLWAQELEEVCSLDGSPDLAQQMKSIYANGGSQKLLQFIVDSQHKGRHFDLLLSASAQVSLGNTEGAFQDLENAYRIRHPNLLRLKADPAWNSLHSDPRFQDMERRIGLN